MTDSEAHKKLKEEEKKAFEPPEREEWTFKVFTSPPGLSIDHFGDRLQLSKSELEDLVEGKVDMARYPMIPKYMYRKIIHSACDALGLVYRAWMVERVTPPTLPKARIEFPPKSIFDEILERTKDLEVKYRIYNEEIKALEEFFRMIKEVKKK